MQKKLPRLLFACASVFLLAGLAAGCSRQASGPEAEAPRPGPIEQVVPEAAQATDAQASRPELPPLFRDIERRTFQFFWDTTNDKNGLTPDRYPSRPFSSIAAVGFALTHIHRHRNGWVARERWIAR